MLSTYRSIDQYIPCDVRTVCFGMAASMGAFLLSAGTKGKRKSLPNSRIMIHQPLGGSQGEATDLEISAKLILHTKDVLNTYLSAFCDQPMDKLRLDTDRDFYMTPEEALSYGIIDEVIQHKNMIKTPKIPSLKVLMSVVLCMQCVYDADIADYGMTLLCRWPLHYLSMMLAASPANLSTRHRWIEARTHGRKLTPRCDTFCPKLG